MMRRTLSLMTLLLLAGPWAHWARAQSIPTAIPYTGSVAVNGMPFSGQGHFKFAIVDQTGVTTYWSNSALGAGSEPINDVTVVVSNGLYALELGNPDLANMQDLPPAVFANPMTFLRVWFSDGVNGFQLLSPDRQLVSVPYAYQAEKANEVSGTGTVVKSLALAETPGVPLTDDILLEGAGNVDVQQIGSTIRIVGTDGTAAAVGLACATPCVSSDEISGTLTDAQIPAVIARDAEVTTAVSGAIATHATTAGAHTLSVLAGSVTDAQIPDLDTLSGVLVDAQIPSAISRDSEVTASVSSAIAAHGNASGAHTLSVLAGSVTDAQIPAGIARDSEVSALLGSVVRSLSPSGGTPLTNDIVLDGAGTVEIQQSGNTITIVGTTGAGAATDLACATPCVSSTEISGTLTDPQIPATISRDAEVSAAIAAHAALDDAHALSSFTTGTLTETRIDAAIARDSEVPGLIGTAVSDEIATHSVAPGAHTLSALAGSVTDAQVPDLGTLSGVLTDAQIPATITHDLNVTGTVTVVALAAGYGRVVRNNLSAPRGATTTLDAKCASGSLLSGGYELDTFPAGVAILGSWPASGSTWSVKVENQSGTDVDVDLYAVCAAIQ